MTRYGQETETTHIDRNTTEDVISNINNYKVVSTYKRISRRIKVNNKKDETTEYIVFSDMLTNLRREKRLAPRSNDVDLLPSFTLEYPRLDVDGSYFVIMTHTELMV